MIRQIYISIKVFSFFLKYSYRLKRYNLKHCFNSCQKPGPLVALGDIQFADRQLRRLLQRIPQDSSCLVHSLTLARLVGSNTEIYFCIQKADNAFAHAYIKHRDHIFTTAQVTHQPEHFLVWSKEC